MPVLKQRYQYQKVFRPSGTKIASGPTTPTVVEAVSFAFEAFMSEFGQSA